MVDQKNQSIQFNLKTSLKTRFIKIRTIWDDRDLDNNNVSDYVTFSNGSVQKMIRIWTLENKRNEEYDYDKNSNRLTLTENGKNRNYTYYKNSAEGNTARVMYDGKWWYTYDNNGNRTAKASNGVHNNNEVTLDKTGEYWEYTWDYHNRLVKVQQFNAPDNAQNVKVEYTYDVINRRIERASYTSGTSAKTQYAYGRNGAITYRKKENSGSSRTFAYLNNQITAFLDKSDDGTENIRYTVTDIQGSVTEVYDEDGSLLWKSGYTAFGIKAGETTNLIDFDGLYTGCDYDAETGLTYYWNRWCGEDGDSWLSQDPARDGLNWYGYAGQNPINYTDPDGRAVHVLIGGGIGALVGLGNQVVKDALSGNISSAADYIGSIAGGAATGAVLAATGNGALAGAAGGLAQNVAKTGTEMITKSVNGEKIDLKQTAKEFAVNTAKDVIIGAGVGAVCKVKGGIPGINSGRGSMSAVAKTTMKKLENGTISNVSVKTSTKIAVSHCVEGALISGTVLGNLINVPASGVADSLLEQPKQESTQDNDSNIYMSAYE